MLVLISKNFADLGLDISLFCFKLNAHPNLNPSLHHIAISRQGNTGAGFNLCGN